MQPKPIAETSRLLSPSLRFCIVFLNFKLPTTALEPVARSNKFLAHFSFQDEQLLYSALSLSWECQTGTVQIASNDDVKTSNQRDELRAELVQKIAQLMGSAEMLETAIPGLTLYRRTSPTAPLSATYEPSLAVVVQGRKRVELRRKTFIYDASRFLLTSVDLPVFSQVIEASEALPYFCLRLKLKTSVVGDLLNRGEIPPAEVPVSGPAMATSVSTVDLFRACSRLMDLLKTPKDIPFLGDAIQREMIYRILQSPEGQRLRAISTLGDQSHRTAKAAAWIRENYAKPLSVEDLAHMAGIGVSTLHMHFRELTSMSPLQYQKQLRLQAARLRMLTDGLDAATVAFEVGYGSATQFSREYSRFFGQPPKRDVQMLRLPDPLPSELLADKHLAVTLARE